jgi:hypothetical protein
MKASTEMTTEKEPIHLLMRFSDKLGAIENTIQAHTEVIKKKGSVWFGKIGKTLGNERVERINQQCADGVVTHLYLVQKSSKVYQVFRGTIAHVSKDLTKEEKALLPQYYDVNDLTRYMKLWVKLTNLQQASLAELSFLRVATSGGDMRETLRTSMAAIFAVKKRSSGGSVRMY